MLTALLSLTLAARAEAPVQQGLLICPDPQTCEEDAAWLRTLGGGGRGGFAVLDFEQVVAAGAVPDDLPARDDYQAALARAREALERGRWGAVLDASNEGIAALGRWRGPVKTQELFDLFFLRGVAAVELGRDQSWSWSFQQAAAVADGQALPTPNASTAARQAWLDEQRKLTVGGRGTLELSGGPPGTHFSVNGRTVQVGPSGTATVNLWPGNHRVTATAPGQIRSWTVEVPVLAERTSAVQPDFTTYDEAATVLAALQQAVLTLQAPEPVADLLVAWCVRNQVQELRLMKVEEVVEQPPPLALTIADPPDDRPLAAAGEAVDMGDGVPTTYEGEVLQRHRVRSEAHAERVQRLRVVFFDPGTRRFSADAAVATALRPAPERLRLGLRASGLSMMQRSHVGLDLGLQVPLGPLSVDTRLGLVRADTAYNLYEGWIDQQLYHLYAGLRWAPSWTVAPFAGAGLDLYAPAAVGGRLSGGLQARMAQDWVAELEGGAGLMDKGLAWGGGLGLARRF